MTKGNGLPCKKCGTSEWYKGGGCVQCANERARKRHQANPEEHRERSHRWDQANPEAVKERNQRYRQNNPQAIKESNRRWRQANLESARERERRYQQGNREAYAVYAHNRRTRKTQAGGSHTPAEWKALVNHYGGKCLCCGRTDVKLTADHVIPVSKGGSSDIDNIQPLCGDCNNRKFNKTIDYRPGSGLGRWIQRKLFG